MPGKNYRVYVTTDVTEAFEPLTGGILATGPTLTFFDASPVLEHKYYRIEVLP